MQRVFLRPYLAAIRIDHVGQCLESIKRDARRQYQIPDQIRSGSAGKGRDQPRDKTEIFEIKKKQKR